MDELGVNPISVAPGESQSAVDPTQLRPSRPDLIRSRLDKQLQLIQAGVTRWTPIQVNSDGVIIDGHHAVRASADLGRQVDVFVVRLSASPAAESILNLSVRGR